jgi:hypothetical protein
MFIVVAAGVDAMMADITVEIEHPGNAGHDVRTSVSRRQVSSFKAVLHT